MPANIQPSVWLGAGYSVDTVNHRARFTTNDAGGTKALPQLTDVLADPLTGDVREVCFALCNAMYKAWIARLVADDKPKEINFQRSVSPGSFGVTDDVTIEYLMRFNVGPVGTYLISALAPSPSIATAVLDHSVKPRSWFGNGYVVDTVNHRIEMTTDDAGTIMLLETNDAAANASSGDARTLFWAIAHSMWEAWLYQHSDPDAPNTPANMSFRLNISPGAALTENFTMEHSFQFTLRPPQLALLPAET